MSEKDRIEATSDELTDQELEQAAGGRVAPGAYTEDGSQSVRAAKRGSAKRTSKSGIQTRRGDLAGGAIE